MKILHTADWHIGKTLYKQSLGQEIRLFFTWMLDLIDQEQIDVLLVSGDIFDLANPANTDKELFYKLLSQLKDKNVQCIITAGNHDSPSLLEAPVDLLKALNIHVIGYGLPIERQLIPVLKDDGGSEVCILATPFLREGDIRKSQSGESYEDKVTALREGILSHYTSLKEHAERVHPGIPVIAMGHLYIQGAHLSDSERDIHIGNLAGLSADRVDNLFDYVALGHIHRPQKLNATGTIRYSGSPIPLSFSERKDEKQVVIIEVEDAQIKEIIPVMIPVFTPLVRLEGSLYEVRDKLESYRSPGEHPAIIEIVVQEKIPDYSTVLETIELAQLPSDHYLIINYRIQFEEQILALSESGLAAQIEDLKPRDVFLQRIENESFEDSVKREVLEAFDEVYTLVTEER